jgi:hypothetical protein
MDECLLKVTHALSFTISDLRAALSKANAIEALILLPMIERTVQLETSVAAFLNARTSQEGGA